MKKQILAILIFFSLGFLNIVKAQLKIPEFEEPEKIEELSSNDEESLPFPFLDGQKIYFVRTTIAGSMKERVKGQDIWSSDFDGENWSKPSNLFKEVNDNGNNAVVGTSKDGNTVYIFNSLQTRRRLARGIAFTKKDEQGSWSDLKKVEIPGFILGDGFYTFYMNPDENILLVGMAASDTSSQNDLFVSQKNAEGNWSELINLGPTINSNGTELSPFIDESGTNLYFSSTGHNGLGGVDIFVSKRLDDTWTNWSTPLNLGAPINSSAFDAYFIIGNDNKVFFTSNRNSTFSDIYSTTIKVDKVKVIANNAQLDSIEQGLNKMENLAIIDKTEMIAANKEIKDIANMPESESLGKYVKTVENQVIVRSEDIAKNVSSNNPKTANAIETNNNAIVDNTSVNNADQPKAINKAKNKTVKNQKNTDSDGSIYFDFNEKTLTNDDKVILEKVIDRLKRDPSAKVTLIGFTDSIGSNEVNVRVASARARSTRQHLLDSGIEKGRITIYGYGEVMFKGDNATEEGRALNRRVEIEISQKKTA